MKWRRFCHLSLQNQFIKYTNFTFEIDHYVSGQKEAFNFTYLVIRIDVL